VAFCDGHVELLSLQDLGYVVNADESVAISGDNRRFSGTDGMMIPLRVNERLPHGSVSYQMDRL